MTPADYEPPGFKPTNVDHFEFVDPPMNVKIGEVETNWHSVKLRIKAAQRHFDEEDENPMNTTAVSKYSP